MTVRAASLSSLFALLLAVGCAPIDELQETPEPTPEPEPEPIELSWSACDGGAECAWLPTPVDPSDPGGETFDLYVARIPASGEAQGTLFLNFGGFGVDGTTQIGFWANAFPALRERFDLVSWAPRGSTNSAPLTCVRHLDEVLDTNGPAPDAATAQLQIDTMTALWDRCREEHGALLDHLSMADHADDLDWLRRALELDEIDYLGYSAGTSLGQVYASHYPERVGRMALDSALPALGGATTLLDAQSSGMAQVLDDWEQWCLASPGCGVHEAPRELMQQVLDEAATAPLETADGRILSWPRAAYGLTLNLYNPLGYATVGFDLEAAAAGDPEPLMESADAYFGRTPDGSYRPLTLVFWGTLCSDELSTRSAAESVDEEQAYGPVAQEMAPVFGAGHRWCAGFGPASDPLVDTPDAAGVDTPILLLQSAIDHATPLHAAEEMHAQLSDSRLVVYEGVGHIATNQSWCMVEHLQGYLLDGVLPEDGTRCTQ